MKTIAISTLLAASGLVMTGCETLGDGNPPRAAEFIGAPCEPAGPHDVAAPGDWICEGETGPDRVKPRHRVEG